MTHFEKQALRELREIHNELREIHKLLEKIANLSASQTGRQPQIDAGTLIWKPNAHLDEVYQVKLPRQRGESS